MLEYRRHEESVQPRMRLRQHDWSSDVFIVVDHADFTAFKAMCDKLQLPLHDLDEAELCDEGARIAERRAYGRP